MKYLGKAILLLCLILSCNQNNNSNNRSKNQPNQSVKNTELKKYKVLTENKANPDFVGNVTTIKDVENLFWRANHSENTNYLCEMSFYDEYAVYNVNYQCVYYFFINTTYAQNYQQIELLWTYKIDCKEELALFKKSHGVKKYPKYGDVFSVYKILNDSTLSVEYKFPEWVEKVNKIANDSLFPKRLNINKEGL